MTRTDFLAFPVRTQIHKKVFAGFWTFLDWLWSKIFAALWYLIRQDKQLGQWARFWNFLEKMKWPVLSFLPFSLYIPGFAKSITDNPGQRAQNQRNVSGRGRQTLFYVGGLLISATRRSRSTDLLVLFPSLRFGRCEIVFNIRAFECFSIKKSEQMWQSQIFRSSGHKDCN